MNTATLRIKTAKKINKIFLKMFKLEKRRNTGNAIPERKRGEMKQNTGEKIGGARRVRPSFVQEFASR